MLFKGRVKFRQYIKTKRARFGIKLYALTTSDGITLVYCGKGMFYNDGEHSSMSSTERIPTVLMDHTWGRGMHSTEMFVLILSYSFCVWISGVLVTFSCINIIYWLPFNECDYIPLGFVDRNVEDRSLGE